MDQAFDKGQFINVIISSIIYKPILNEIECILWQEDRRLFLRIFLSLKSNSQKTNVYKKNRLTYRDETPIRMYPRGIMSVDNVYIKRQCLAVLS